MVDNNWKVNDLIVCYYKNNSNETITDIGVIESFHDFNGEKFADIRLLYSKYSPVNTMIHAPKDEVHIIGNVNELSIKL